jgi:hypothetical protein
MKMKKSILALAALAFLAWGCASDSDSTSEPQPPTPPAPTEIEAGTDVRPSWTAPNYNLFEQTMTVEVQLQERLLPYASANDLMTAIVGSEVRGISTPQQVNDQWVFPITVASNAAGEQLSLSYYCDKLHRIFTINWTQFDATVAPTGQGGIYLPKFVE